MSDPGRLAAVDFGTKRIGVAITDVMRSIASPHCGYQRATLQQDADWFRRLVADEQIVQFVVGLPVHISGDEGQKSLMAREFGCWLQEVTGIPVMFHDERHSTQQADAWMSTAGLSRKQQATRRDMLAAQAILASFLEQSDHSMTDPSEAPHALDDEATYE